MIKKEKYGNIIDYLKSNQKSFIEQSFHDVDGLVFSYLAYYNFESININSKRVKISSIENELLLNENNYHLSNYDEKKEFLIALKSSNRYKDIEVSNFIRLYNLEKEEQFCGVLFHYKDLFSFVSFRGTDTTIYGWKEDLNLSYSYPLISQCDALSYLNNSYKYLNKIIYVGGHSKGGNLAVYSAINSYKYIYKHIIHIYSYDGPGFKEVFFKSKKYKERKYKIIKYVPEFSIFGMIMEESEDFKVINAKGFTIMEHIVFNWIIKDNNFDILTSITSGAYIFDKAINKWLLSYDDETKKRLVSLLYSIIINNNILRVEDIRNNLLNLVKTYNALDKESKIFIKKVTKKFISLTLNYAKDNLINETSKTKEIIKNKINFKNK